MGSKNETANVTVNINGKQASDTMKSVRQDVNRLTAELSKLPIGTAEFTKKLDELKGKKQILDDLKGQVQKTSSAWEKMLTVAGGMGIYALATKGLGAISSGMEQIGKIAKTSDAATDQWEKTTTALKFAWDSVLRTIATGDWSNLLTNMNLAIQSGKEYAEIMDEIAERQASLDVNNAQTRLDILDQRRIMKDKTLDETTRANAALKVMELENSMMLKNKEIAELATDAEVKKYAAQTGLGEATIEKYVTERNANNEKVKSAEKYLDLLKEEQTYMNLTSQRGQVNKQASAELSAIRDEIAKTSPEVKLYAEQVVSKFGKAEAGAIESLSKVMVAEKNATAEYMQGTEKTYGLYTGFLNELKKGDDKRTAEAKKSSKDQQTALDELNQKLKEYEDALLDAVITGDPKEAQVYAEKIARVKAYKAAIDDLIKSLQEQADTQTKITPLPPIEFDTNKGFGGGNTGVGLGTPGKAQATGVGMSMPGESAGPYDELALWASKANQVIEYAAIVEASLAGVDQALSMSENAELARDQALNEQKKANLKKQLDAKLISESFYNDQVAKMDADLDKEKRKIVHDQAVRQKELALLTAIINTAAGMTTAFINPGGVAGIVLAALIGILGGIQIGVIASEKVPQAAKGKYNVIGQDDGRLYTNVPYEGTPRTGIYSKPTLISEQGGEMIIDAPTTRNIQVNHPDLMRAIHFARVPQYAEGSYPSNISSSSPSLSNDAILMELKSINQEMQNTNNKLTNLKAGIVYSEFEEAQDTVNRIRGNSSKQ